ncbi:hypothetical protein ACQ4PT_053838 [Festuca glaucescens]
MGRSGRDKFNRSPEMRKETAAVCRAAAEEARRKDRPKEEQAAVARWKATGDPEAAAYQSRLQEEHLVLFNVLQREERHVLWEDSAVGRDEEALWAARYRDGWNGFWAPERGTYEDSSKHTFDLLYSRLDNDYPGHALHGCRASPTGTWQVFSFKVAAIAEELRWPLDVYGLIAVRDHVDRNRNIVFARSRDNCQTITAEDPYLTLTGPSRAPVLCSLSNSVRFEVVLKVKGATNESEDKDLSFLASKYRTFKWHTHVVNYVDTNNLCKLELTFDNLAESVEATITIQVIHGSWLDGCRGIFSASTSSLDKMKVRLLSLEDGKLPLTVDGMIKLSRHVACVEIEGELKISVATEYADGKQVTASDDIVFTPRKAGRSCAILKVFSCEMKVIVAWSLVSDRCLDTYYET